jgi:hypothetical protein
MKDCFTAVHREDIPIQAIINSLWGILRYSQCKHECAAGSKCDLKESMGYAVKGCERSMEYLEGLSLDAILNDNER